MTIRYTWISSKKTTNNTKKTMKGNDYLIKLISKYLDLFGTAHLRIIELCDNQNADYLKLNIIKDWFSKQSLDSFSKKHPVKHISENSISILKEQLKTLEKSDMKHIPTIFLNDFEFKQEYFEVRDIPFLFIDIQTYKAQHI